MGLLAVLCAGQQDAGAYGITVHYELVARTRRRVKRGAVYMTLHRLEKKGLPASFFTEPPAKRGGRRNAVFA